MVTRVVLVPCGQGWRVEGRFTLRQIRAMRKAGATILDLEWTETKGRK